jgi:hypothetical protein
MEANSKNLGETTRCVDLGEDRRANVPGVSLKMIDNLFNSFTCDAVAGTAVSFSTRD